MPDIIDRRARILAELAALDRAALPATDWAKEWAGTYYTGDGLATNISIDIAPKAGAAFQSSCCTGTIDANHGDIVRAITGGVKIQLYLDPDTRAATFDSTLYFVQWGDRKYLVPAFRMPGIVSRYNAGQPSQKVMLDVPEQYVGQLPYERYDRRPEPKGKPELPAEFAARLIDRPAKAPDALPTGEK